VTLNLGLHRRRWVEGATMRGQSQAYEDAWIRRRSAVLGYAIDARRQHFPGETPFAYAPHVASGETYRWGEAARQQLSGYHADDLII
jgi:hypothetical protein